MTSRLMRIKIQMNNKKIIFPKSLQNAIKSYPVAYPIKYPVAHPVTSNSINGRTIQLVIDLPTKYAKVL